MTELELETCVVIAKGIFKEIKSKYPKLDGYLAIAHRGAYSKLSGSFQELFNSSPSFFMESETRTLLVEKQKRLKALAKERDQSPKDERAQVDKQIEALSEGIAKSVHKLDLSPSATIEIIWNEIDYDLVRLLRSDEELIDVWRTPQIGGIKLVLGAVGEMLIDAENKSGK